MTKFQNMKIEINEQQPLDEIINELERLDYECQSYLNGDKVCVLAQDDGNIIGCNFDMDNNYWELTTLAQLKAMEK